MSKTDTTAKSKNSMATFFKVLRFIGKYRFLLVLSAVSYTHLTEKICVVPENYRIGLRRDLTDIKTAGRRNAKAAALADRVMDDPLMASDIVSLFIYKITLRCFFACVLLNKFRIVAVRYKADILTVMLSGIDKAMFFGNDTNLVLPETSKRKLYMCQLFLGQQDVYKRQA